MNDLQFIHEPWFVSLYPFLVFGLAFVLGRFTARTPMDVRDREYKAGWDAGHDAAMLELKEIVRTVLVEMEDPNVLIHKRSPVFFKCQAD